MPRSNTGDSARAADARRTPRHDVWLLVLFALGLATGPLLSRVAWRSHADLHTLLEALACLLAVGVGLGALARHRRAPSDLWLLMGIGFLGTGLLDAYHTLLTFSHFSSLFPSELDTLAPWSWLASRLFSSVLFVFTWLTLRGQRRGEPLDSPSTMYFLVAIGLTATLTLFSTVSLPAAHFPDFPLPRPAELLPAVAFGAALLGFLRLGQWRPRKEEFWIVTSLVLSFVGQVGVMAFSNAPFDLPFDVAHGLKLLAYTCVGAAVLTSSTVDPRSSEPRRTAREVAWSLQLRATLAFLVISFAVTLAFAIQQQGQQVAAMNSLGLVLYGFTLLALVLATCFVLMPLVRQAGSALKSLEALNRELEARVEERTSEAERGRWLAEKANTELFRRNRELDDFAYIASHDLKSPLRDVHNLSDWLREDLAGKLPERSEHHLELIGKRMARMEALLDDLLNYSRAGKRESAPEPVCIGELVREAVNLLSLPAGFSVVCREPDSKVTLNTSRTALGQVLRNLIDNAIKHHDRGHGTVVVTADPLADGVEISVQDDGPGISAEHHERIFRMFQRLRPDHSVEGSGIGLAIVKKLIEHHGGSITVQKHSERGTTFRFSWVAETSSSH